MLRVTKLADYGIIVLTQFARRPDQVLNARDVSQQVRLPLPVVSKVLKLLARNGLLVSHRGKTGGYGLGRRPGEITVASVIRAFEGPIAMTECTDRAKGDCSMEKNCPVRTNWHRINAAIYGALEGITLEQMARPMPAEWGGLRGEEGPGQAFRVL
jgi:FeS assembly SUF system regulator